MHNEAERVPIFNLCHPHALDVPLGALLQLLLFGEIFWRLKVFTTLSSKFSSANLYSSTLTPLICTIKEWVFCKTQITLSNNLGSSAFITHWRMRGTCPYLGGSEAEGGGVCVRPLSVLEHQPSVLRQGQVVTRGQVSESERLAPADVAPAPTEKVATIITK